MTDMAGPLALAMDELLARLTPEMAEQIGTLSPVGLRDQLRAASDDARRLVTGIHFAANPDAGEDSVRMLPTAEVIDWMRLGLLHTLVRWSMGQASTCMHSPRMDRPQPVFAAAWRPGLVVCEQCLHLFHLAGVRDSTCDGCGYVCKGLEHDDGIWPLTVTLGAMVYQAGACKDCHEVAPG